MQAEIVARIQLQPIQNKIYSLLYQIISIFISTLKNILDCDKIFIVKLSFRVIDSERGIHEKGAQII